MMKVGRVFQIAEHRDAVRFGGRIDRHRGPQPGSAQRADAETEHMSTAELRHASKTPQDRLPILAALSASYHQIAGNAERPYFGSSGGRPKRSQRAVRTFG